jgi:uncharacterized protein YjaG (DUF416 family)
LPALCCNDKSQRRNVNESEDGSVALMSIIRYSREQLIEKLDQLPRSLRVTFAAACAERLLPAYFTSWGLTGKGDPEMLARILARLWEDLAGNPMTESEVQLNISTCMHLIPVDYHEPWFVEQASAEDASAAVAQALMCHQSGDSQDAMWSAERVYNALDQFVVDRENIVLWRRGAMERVLAHPLIQAELARQRRDIEELLGAADADEDVRQIAVRFRERAKAEAAIVFGVPS